jgi:hypothetical protein
MDEIRVADASLRRFNTAATLLTLAAVVAIAYRCDRAYRRWLEEISPLAAPRVRLARLRTDWRQRRANVTGVAQVISSVLDEVAGASRRESR